MADSHPGKLFVGGIGWGTSEATLKDHFSHYGQVLSSVIARDRCDGTPRGFGFVVFADPSSADRALEHLQHVIQGRKVDVKRAIPRSECVKSSQRHLDHSQHTQDNGTGFSKNNNGTIAGGTDGENQIRTRKVFVGGLKADLTVEEFRSYFERFGRIEDIVVMHDHRTNRPRGFGFITFESEEVAENVTRDRFYEVEGKVVEVKRAVPKETCSVSYNNDCDGRGCSGRVPSFGGYVKESCIHRNYVHGWVDEYYCGTCFGGYMYRMGVDSSVAYAVPWAVPTNPWWYLPMYATGLPACHAAYYPTNMDSRLDFHRAMTYSGSADSGFSRKCEGGVCSSGCLSDNACSDKRCSVSGDTRCCVGKPDPGICKVDGPLDNTNSEVGWEQRDGDDPCAVDTRQCLSHKGAQGDHSELLFPAD